MISDINIFQSVVVCFLPHFFFFLEIEEENSFNAEQEEEGLYLKIVEREKISRESLPMENEKNFKQMCVHSYVYIYTRRGGEEEVRR